MSEDALAREVDRLCADCDRPENSNVGFVSERLFGLMKAGHRLADVESELRRRDAPIFLVGRPFSGPATAQFRLNNPSDTVDDGQLRHYLWIGINGREEVDRVLAEESISAAANLANLDTTGLLIRRELPEHPTAAELLDWLTGDTLTWAERASMIRRHLDLLRTAESLDALASRAPAIGDLVRSAARDGIGLAFQNCRPLVREAVQAFVDAPTWAAAGTAYRTREGELSGDLAQEMLLAAGRQPGLTAAQRAVIDAHVRALEVAWERGIEAAIGQASRDFPVKAGTPAAEDYLRAYLDVPDLEAARDMLRTAPPELFQIDDDTLAEGLRRSANGDRLWRIGMFHDARERGPDAAYQDWAELAAIEALGDDAAAIEQLTALAGRHRGCLRDRTLELLSNRYMRIGDLGARRAIMRELVDHRSADSPPAQRVFDLVILGLILGEQGELETARARIHEALALITSIRDQAQRGLLWTRVGGFCRFRGDDLPMAVHSLRVAVEEFRGAGDLASEAFALEQLSAIYRDMFRVDLASVYAALAQRAVLAWDRQRPGLAVAGDVTFLVEGGVARTEFLRNDFAAAARRLKGLLGPPGQAGDDRRLPLERVALAAAVASGDLAYGREIIAAWAARGSDDWVAVGRALLAAHDILARDPSSAIVTARVPELAGLGDALVRLGVPRPDAESFLDHPAPDKFATGLLHSLAGVSNADPLINRRLASEYDDLAVTTRSDRAAAKLAPPRREAGTDIALPPGSSWPDVVARYHDLGVWELPDLAILGGVLDRWSSRSRFGGAVRINPSRPRDGCLNFYFYRSDPERHLGGVHSCSYIPAGDLIVCSLPYLDSMFRIDDAQWEAGISDWERKAAAAADEPSRGAAETMARLIRGYEHIIAEWIVAHEIGHAHLGHAAAPSAEDALALEEAADAFFLDGALADASVGVITLAFYSLLNRLYSYDCERQFHRTVTPRDLLDHPLVLDSTPDETGHRPLVFRAVSLVKSILSTRPDIEDSTYIDKFAASLEGRGERAS